MLAILMGLGLTNKAAKIVAYFAVPVLIIGALWLGLHLYGNARYDAGHDAADKEWREASDRLIEKSMKAGAKADKADAHRQAEFAARQEDEKEKIHEALEQGNSPYDALFPGE